VRELWDSGQAEAEADLPAGPDPIPGTSATRILAGARRRGTRVLTPAALCGHTRHFGAARVDVLSPCPSYDPGWSPNDNSLVLRITLGRRTLLFTGDAEAHQEETLVSQFGRALRADILKVGHHGSRTSTTPPFLSAVRPRYAVISSGAVNRFGHPHAEPLRNLAAARVRVIRLADGGGRSVRSDGVSLTFE
jgi:competence protein ComEC